MTTEKQIETNQENALLSTGARTEEGKAIVSKNAVKHGIFTKELVIEHGDGKEDKVEYEELLQNLIDYFNPQGQLETTLVEKIAVDFWRLKRVIRFETGSIRRYLDHAIDDYFGEKDFDGKLKHKRTKILQREMDETKREVKNNTLFIEALKKEQVDLTQPSCQIEGVGDWDIEEDIWALMDELADDFRDCEYYDFLDSQEPPLADCLQILQKNGFTHEKIKTNLIQCFERKNTLLLLEMEEKQAEINKNVYRSEVQKRVKVLPSEDISDKVLRYERNIEKSIFQKIIMLTNLRHRDQN